MEIGTEHTEGRLIRFSISSVENRGKTQIYAQLESMIWKCRRHNLTMHLEYGLWCCCPSSQADPRHHSWEAADKLFTTKYFLQSCAWLLSQWPVNFKPLLPQGTLDIQSMIFLPQFYKNSCVHLCLLLCSVTQWRQWSFAHSVRD